MKLLVWTLETLTFAKRSQQRLYKDFRPCQEAVFTAMFAKPRPKKSILPPPSKKRKTTSAVEEVNFDLDARQEYLTGFHKRKQQRIKLAQEENAKRAHQEKLEMRKQVHTLQSTGYSVRKLTVSIPGSRKPPSRGRRARSSS